MKKLNEYQRTKKCIQIMCNLWEGQKVTKRDLNFVKKTYLQWESNESSKIS